MSLHEIGDDADDFIKTFTRRSMLEKVIFLGGILCGIAYTVWMLGRLWYERRLAHFQNYHWRTYQTLCGVRHAVWVLIFMMINVFVTVVTGTLFHQGVADLLVLSGSARVGFGVVLALWFLYVLGANALNRKDRLWNWKPRALMLLVGLALYCV
jgi:energy-converting hydrogenase Eha subunit G